MEIILVLVGVMASLAVGIWMGHDDGRLTERWVWKRELVKRGHARWVVDVDGHMEWEWINKQGDSPCSENELIRC